MDGEDDSPGKQGLRPAVPHSDGPPEGPPSGSGAAPGPTDSSPGPEARPSVESTPAESTPTESTWAETMWARTAPAESTPAHSPPPDHTALDATRPDATSIDGTRVAATPVDATRTDATRAPKATTAPMPAVGTAAGGVGTAVSGVDAPAGGADGGGSTDGGTGKDGGGSTDPAVGAAAAVGPGRPAARRLHPVAAARAAGRAGVSWARGPSGRVVVPSVLAILLIGGAGAAGVYLVPDTVDAVPAADAGASVAPGVAAPSGAPVVPGGGFGSGSASLPPFGDPGAPPGSIAPGGPVGGAPALPATPGARPADALTGWAQQVGTKLGIPLVAAQAYGYAELVLNRTAPACRLSWTTIAALAKVESDHGSANNAALGPDGKSQPAIVGLPLDGKGGRRLIKDTDRGALDGDAVFDRAMGPLQFIPSTWRENAVDADNDGVTDPNDIDDAALTTGMYLCRDGRDMSKADDWWNAILSYNNVQPYAQQVFTEANGYGQRSRT